MASIFFRARATALTALVGVLTAQIAFAADMPFATDVAPPPDRPVEFGTGWYLRGDIGYSNTQVPVIIADFANSLGRQGSVSGGLGFGYQYNSWLRSDVTFDRTVFRPSAGQPPVWCPSGTIVDWPSLNAADVNAQYSGQPAGYSLNLGETCTPQVTASFDRTSAMANVYFDIGHWSGFTPYVGAGLGTSYLQTHAAVTWDQNWNGAPWAPNLLVNGVPGAWVTGFSTTTTTVVVTPASSNTVTTTNGNNPPTTVTTTTPAVTAKVPVTTPVYGTPPRALLFEQLQPNTAQQKKSWKFSYNLMAGVSYDVTQNIKVDLHYRFLNAGSYTGLPSQLTGAPGVTKDLISQEIRLGVRLSTD